MALPLLQKQLLRIGSVLCFWYRRTKSSSRDCNFKIWGASSKLRVIVGRNDTFSGCLLVGNLVRKRLQKVGRTGIARRTWEASAQSHHFMWLWIAHVRDVRRACICKPTCNEFASILSSSLMQCLRVSPSDRARTLEIARTQNNICACNSGRQLVIVRRNVLKKASLQ